MLLSLALACVFGRARRLERKRRALSAWVELLSHVRDQISCFAMPLPEILLNAPPRAARLLGWQTGGELADVCRVWAEELGGESARLLRRLADELGGIWRQEQVDRLNAYVGALEKQRLALEGTLVQRLRLEGALTLCGTLALILLIW